jgi:hypothetical protein
MIPSMNRQANRVERLTCSPTANECLTNPANGEIARPVAIDGANEFT